MVDADKTVMCEYDD